MIVGCYGLDLYCRNQDGPYDRTHYLGPGPGAGRFVPYPEQFEGPSEAYCKRAARRRGWVFNRDGDATCPLCAGKWKPAPTTPER